jgi:hypothetical protein
VPNHFEKLAGHMRLPSRLVGARFMSRHVCEVLRKSAVTQHGYRSDSNERETAY